MIPALIPFAGGKARKTPTVTRRQLAYELFEFGKDTAQIAKQMNQPESTVLRWINIERANRLGLPSPYKNKESA